jgi:O-acetyl-ADP-ribose deacetylase (regulator of RNase III)
MIRSSRGNLLDADVEALVNTVNTEGVMGKGIALQFKRAFPAMFKDYASAAKRGDIRLGHVHVWATNALTGPKWVINFPTKGNWRAKSRLSDIESGLDDLVSVVRSLGIRSIAVPPLGCGNGGLAWSKVEPLIREAFDSLPEVDAWVFAPDATPSASEMKSNSPRPKWTVGKAALVDIVHRYAEQAFEVSLIEVQKLMYFLQEAGEPLRLKYVKGIYGPYAENLRHSLATVEGHFLVGFGDGSQPVLSAEPIDVLPGVADEATRFLANHQLTKDRITRVLELSEGFESAYGMELLATVHWIATQPEFQTSGPEEIAKRVAEWSPRKQEMFGRQHVKIAWQHLLSGGWVEP